MIVMMKPGATLAQHRAVEAAADKMGYKHHFSVLAGNFQRTMISITGDKEGDATHLERMPGVESVKSSKVDLPKSLLNATEGMASTVTAS